MKCLGNNLIVSVARWKNSGVLCTVFFHILHRVDLGKHLVAEDGRGTSRHLCTYSWSPLSPKISLHLLEKPELSGNLC